MKKSRTSFSTLGSARRAADAGHLGFVRDFVFSDGADVSGVAAPGDRADVRDRSRRGIFRFVFRTRSLFFDPSRER
jgi:hypothetical protein